MFSEALFIIEKYSRKPPKCPVTQLDQLPLITLLKSAEEKEKIQSLQTR